MINYKIVSVIVKKNIYDFEGGSARRKTRIFLVEIFQKVPKNAFFTCFFLKKFACGSENFSLNRVLILFWESSENQIDQPKRKSGNVLFCPRCFFV